MKLGGRMSGKDGYPGAGPEGSAETTARWPRPAFDDADQPHFLFLITPPHAGSTALAQLLNSSARMCLLQERGEGQWLVPGLCEGDRWDASKQVDYDSVRAVWLAAWRQARQRQPDARVAIEKSPPNMVRLEDLSGLFRSYSFLANNRDPYANCASILYRYHDPDGLAARQRQARVERLAREWLLRSAKIRELMERLGAPLLTYERFCADPAAVIPLLKLPPGAAEGIDAAARVKVKDYGIQAVSNHNARQAARLSARDMGHISGVLAPHAELLDCFGYHLRETRG